MYLFESQRHKILVCTLICEKRPFYFLLYLANDESLQLFWDLTLGKLLYLMNFGIFIGLITYIMKYMQFVMEKDISERHRVPQNFKKNSGRPLTVL